MKTQMTASVNMFNPASRLIFFFEDKIGEVTEQGDGFFAESIYRKKALFRTYNMACDFLQRCYERIERKRINKVMPGQLGLIF